MRDRGKDHRVEKHRELESYRLQLEKSNATVRHRFDTNPRIHCISGFVYSMPNLDVLDLRTSDEEDGRVYASVVL